jgi:hypothetical protein
VRILLVRPATFVQVAIMEIRCGNVNPASVQARNETMRLHVPSSRETGSSPVSANLDTPVQHATGVTTAFTEMRRVAVSPANATPTEALATSATKTPGNVIVFKE